MPNTNRTSRHDRPGDADRHSYHPNVSGDWSSPEPKTVQQGLDDLAAAVTGGALPVPDTTALVKGSADATKEMRFEVDGVTTGTVRVITVADQDIDMTPASGTYPASSLTLTAGDGITGGGDLSANRSFAVDLATDPGLEIDSAKLRAKVDDSTIERTASGLGVKDIGARVYNTSNISTLDSTWTSATFDSERWDTDTIHSTSSNTSRLTATTAGKYLIIGHIFFASNSTGQRAVRIRLNGTTIIAQQSTSSVHTSRRFSIPVIYDMAATDYVEIQGFQDSGGALNMVAIANMSPEFSMQKLA